MGWGMLGIGEGQLALALAASGVALVMARRWRPVLGALFAQYLLVGLLLAGSVGTGIAGMKILVGTMNCVILYGTLYHRHGSGAPREGGDGQAETLAGDRLGAAARLISVVLVGGVVYFILGKARLPGLSPDQTFASLWLVAIGLLMLVLEEGTFGLGMGLLTLQMGFELFYTVQERGLSVAGVLGIMNLFLALAIAYFISGFRPGIAERGED